MDLAEIAEDKSKIALIDLLRLIVLEEEQAAHVFGPHWMQIDNFVFEYVGAMDLKDLDNKVGHNYHLACFKFLTNSYQTKVGK